MSGCVRSLTVTELSRLTSKRSLQQISCWDSTTLLSSLKKQRKVLPFKQARGESFTVFLRISRRRTGTLELRRIHRFFGQALSAYAGVDQSNWDFYLPGLLTVYNGSVHETTGYSPAMLMFGRELSFPGLIPEKGEDFESYP